MGFCSRQIALEKSFPFTLQETSALALDKRVLGRTIGRVGYGKQKGGKVLKEQNKWYRIYWQKVKSASSKTKQEQAKPACTRQRHKTSQPKLCSLTKERKTRRLDINHCKPFGQSEVAIGPPERGGGESAPAAGD
ncbi:hypothetical protein GUITHDRAFT_117128 [Guillardia theta CCMP2712]|uniref:Uncharacterized protein n=1 Tax=Guillardia theta (strain CCMP2712) TaxID=905079 RepID=L1IKP2_GUITC|nr:hypothetical protein GUITHDRAFT_117128 [Guillardia theta CCMP2712]EKX36702.1 hypothetical protein GUITHDRAFT_117128 [Guillardia theta CCMP2712]|eukprot:XP_005823682.1 hypothetical protein GUITHDRAFT_117128 [Guillardia theta CCMP2712]